MKLVLETKQELIVEKLKSLRQIIGLQVFQAAEYLSISKLHYLQIETGEVLPSQAEIDKLCSFIKLPKTWIRNSDESLHDFEQRVYDRLADMQSRKVEFREKAPEKLGDKIKVIRKAHGLTKDQMSNILGLTYKLYSSYERGDPNIPKVYFDKITTVFRIPAYWLLDDHISIDEFDEFYRKREKMQTEAITSMEHYICKVDKEGGIHLPYAVSKTLNIAPNTSLAITASDDGTFQIAKAWKRCRFCNSDDDLITFENFNICRKCIHQMDVLVDSQS